MKPIRVKKINIGVSSKIILLRFAFLIYIIKIRRTLLYVKDTIIPYIKFGSEIIISLSLFIVRNLFNPKKKVYRSLYSFFIIPLLVAYILPATTVSSKSISLISTKSTQQIVNTKQDKSIVYNIASPEKTTIKVDAKLNIQGNTVFMTDNNFLKWTQEISYNMAKYEGKKIELTGFVFKGDGFKYNEFVPARFLMTCCTSDLQPIGLLAHYDKAKALKQDTWLIVTGTIKIIDYHGEKTPVIIVASVKNTSKPTIEYVYPF